jgi:4-hydroxybenzoate polyprenyltransferase
MHFFQLIRIGNLIMLVITQLLLWAMVIRPLLSTYGMHTVLSLHSALLLVATTVLQAAAGYVINDYFDRESDRINEKRASNYQPQRLKQIHHLFVFASLITGSILAYRVHSLALFGIFILIPFSLWYYSSHLKRLPFVGNLLVALLTALSIALTSLVPFLELLSLYKATIYTSSVPTELLKITAFFTLFAFLLTLVRELVKDMEDIRGDQHSGYQTLPIVAGVKTTRVMISVIILLLFPVIGLSTRILLPFNDLTALIYIAILVMLPLAIALYKLATANSRTHYHKVSVLLKAIMLCGLGYSIVYHCQLSQHYSLKSCLF